MSRIPAVTQSELPSEYQYLLDEDALGERNIFTTMGNNPAVLKSYMLYGSTVWDECGLSARERELAILAVARELGSRYEWEQHVDIGYDAGVTAAEMRAVGAGEVHKLDDRVSAVLEYVQAFAVGSVTNNHQTNLAEHFDYDDIVGIGMLASHYVATARFLNGFNVSLEQPTFIGWDPSDEDVEALASE